MLLHLIKINGLIWDPASEWLRCQFFLRERFECQWQFLTSGLSDALQSLSWILPYTPRDNNFFRTAVWNVKYKVSSKDLTDALESLFWIPPYAIGQNILQLFLNLHKKTQINPPKTYNLNLDQTCGGKHTEKRKWINGNKLQTNGKPQRSSNLALNVPGAVTVKIFR